ncbi:hypothetical protein BRC83_06605 [Halobacteriales archaeon QS_1_68_17]|nr:MAG: hypothetical protein BRC83_06605 [Halobacteriales archaeon QS_1_68_17]
MSHRDRSPGSREPGHGANGEERDRVDAGLALLADVRRRELVDYLSTAGDGTIALEELAEQIGDDDETDRLRRSLYHRHLPKLAAHGVVEFDAERQAVRYVGHERVEEILASL